MSMIGSQFSAPDDKDCPIPSAQPGMDDNAFQPRSVRVTLPGGKDVTFGIKQVGLRGFLNHKQLSERLGVGSHGALANSIRDKGSAQVRCNHLHSVCEQRTPQLTLG